MGPTPLFILFVCIFFSDVRGRGKKRKFPRLTNLPTPQPRGGHGLPKVSLGSAMHNPSTLCGWATPQKDKRMDGRKDGWMDRWMERWMDIQMDHPILLNTILRTAYFEALRSLTFSALIYQGHVSSTKDILCRPCTHRLRMTSSGLCACAKTSVGIDPPPGIRS
jgi:hypothetical protein